MNQGTKTVLVVGGTAAVLTAGVWYTHYLWNLQEAGDKLDIRLSHFDNLTVSGGDLIGEFKLAFTNNGSVDLELQKVHLGLFLDDTELTRLSKVGTADLIPPTAQSTIFTFRFHTPIISTAFTLVSQLLFSGIPKQGVLRGKVTVSGFTSDIVESVPIQLKRKDESTTLSGLPTLSNGLLVPWANTCEYGWM